MKDNPISEVDIIRARELYLASPSSWEVVVWMVLTILLLALAWKVVGWFYGLPWAHNRVMNRKAERVLNAWRAEEIRDQARYDAVIESQYLNGSSDVVAS